MSPEQDDWRARWERVMAPTYATPTLRLARGSGVHVFDTAGRSYLDFIAGIAVSATGHAHPRVVAAVTAQAARLFHTSNLYATDENLALAERLTDRTGYGRVFFANSGAEVNEFAIKLARRHAVRTLQEPSAIVLACEGSFHGRSLATVALTGQPKHRVDFDPIPTGFAHVPFNDVAALEAAFERHRVAAFVLEVVQGESGVRVADPAFVAAARRLADAHGALLIIDEVQTGVGRTGRFLAQEWFGVRADVTTLAKGLASGVPIGACLFDERLAALMGPGDHGCTFGGNPLASVAALATLDTIDAEKLLENAAAVGGTLRVSLAEHVHGLAEVRGLGLLAAAEFAAPVALRVRQDAQAAGLLVNNVGERTLRLAPPLVASHADATDAAEILRKVAPRDG